MISTHQKALPPSPPIPSLIQTALFLRHPFPFVQFCQRRYGDLYRLRLSVFGDVVYIAHVDAIRQVFAADGTTAHAGEANAILQHVTGQHSVLTLDREEHLEERRLISSALHGKALIQAQSDIARIAAEEEANWPDDRPIAMRPALQRLTFRIIANLLLGREEESELRRLLMLLEPVFGSIPLAVIPPTLRIKAGSLTPWGRFSRARSRLDDELLRIIVERRGAPPGPDLLSLLVHGTDPDRRRSDEQARDELVTLLLAGHETSATALSWALERLARHPHALAAAHKAAMDNDHDYLDAIAHETLRVRPVVMDVARVLSQPLTIAGYELPAGTTVMPSIYLVHTDDRHHQDPHAFRPERFLATRPEPATWLPFGGGRRRCAGAALAMLEIRTVLQTVLTRRTLRAPNPSSERPVLRGITFAPHNDATLEVPKIRREESEPIACRQPISVHPGARAR
ncbi:MAG: cytochrome P450 [Solirubrobacteraceae bacterium]